MQSRLNLFLCQIALVDLYTNTWICIQKVLNQIQHCACSTLATHDNKQLRPQLQLYNTSNSLDTCMALV